MKRYCFAVLAAASVLVLVGCGDESNPTAAVTEETINGTWYVTSVRTQSTKTTKTTEPPLDSTFTVDTVETLIGTNTIEFAEDFSYTVSLRENSWHGLLGKTPQGSTESGTWVLSGNLLSLISSADSLAFTVSSSGTVTNLSLPIKQSLIYGGISVITTGTITVSLSREKPVFPAPVMAVEEAGDESVTVSWGSVGGATYYDLYYARGSTVTKSNTKVRGVTSPHTITDLPNGVTYAFAVAAGNDIEESALSAFVTAKPALPVFEIAGTWKAQSMHIFGEANIHSNNKPWPDSTIKNDTTYNISGNNVIEFKEDSTYAARWDEGELFGITMFAKRISLSTETGTWSLIGKRLTMTSAADSTTEYTVAMSGSTLILIYEMSIRTPTFEGTYMKLSSTIELYMARQ